MSSSDSSSDSDDSGYVTADSDEEKKLPYQKGQEKQIISIYKCRTTSTYNDYKGFTIQTHTRTIVFEIESTQSCGEDWGIDIIFPRNRVQDDFIGKNLGKVKFGPDIEEERGALGCTRTTVQLYLHTCIGRITIQAYNEHNGYYPHQIRLKKDGKTDIQTI